MILYWISMNRTSSDSLISLDGYGDIYQLIERARRAKITGKEIRK